MIKKALFPQIISVFLMALVLLSASTSTAKRHSGPKITVIQVPFETVEALKGGNINGAAKALNPEATSPQTKYLLLEMEQIIYAEKNEKEISGDKRKLHNVGIAYHNLYLFMKGEGYESEVLFKKGLSYYKKALGTRSPFRKNAVYLNMAAIYASAGNSKMSQKYFSKVKPDYFRDEFQKYATYALYYAAANDVANAIINLEAAYNINSEHITEWLGISNDFTHLAGNPEFDALMKKWGIKRLNRGTSIYSS